MATLYVLRTVKHPIFESRIVPGRYKTAAHGYTEDPMKAMHYSTLAAAQQARRTSDPSEIVEVDISITIGNVVE